MHCDQYWQTAAAAYLNWRGSQLIADIDSLYMMAQMAAENCESEHANEGGEGLRASESNGDVAQMQAALAEARKCIAKAMK